MYQSLLYLILGAAIGAIVFWYWKERSKPDTDKKQNESLERMERRLNEMSQLVLSQLNERLRENRDSVQSVTHQFQSFTREVTSLTETVKQVQSSVQEVSSFQDILRAPKLRGRWGELSLEHLLAQYFPRESYELQHPFSSGEMVDAYLKLPNERGLPIDAKFPLEDFTRMVEAENETQRLAFQKSFAAQVKKEIDDIARKYILPGEGTTEFALMYIPAEAVFYEIVSRMQEEDLPATARNKRVILVSPNTFFLMIQVIQHWARDLAVGKQTQDILKRLGRISADAKRLSADFEKLGKYISGARGSYDDIQKRVGLLVERIERVVEVDGSAPLTINLLESEPRSRRPELVERVEAPDATPLLEDSNNHEDVGGQGNLLE